MLGKDYAASRVETLRQFPKQVDRPTRRPPYHQRRCPTRPAHYRLQRHRLNAEAQEPLELKRGIDPAIVQTLREMGHRMLVRAEVAAGAHGAEVLKSEGKVRAGGNGWAAGV